MRRRQIRAKARVNREVGPRPARPIVEPAAPVQALRTEVGQAVAGAVPARAAWIEAGQAREVTAPGVEASLPLPAAETAAHLAAPRVRVAAVPLEPAAAEALPAMEEVPAAVVVAVPAVAAAVDGGR